MYILFDLEYCVDNLLDLGYSVDNLLGLEHPTYNLLDLRYSINNLMDVEYSMDNLTNHGLRRHFCQTFSLENVSEFCYKLLKYGTVGHNGQE